MNIFANRGKGRNLQEHWKYMNKGGAPMSLDQVREKVSNGIRTLYEPKGKKSTNGPALPTNGPWVKEVFPDRVVFEHDGKLKARHYKCEPDGKPEFGDEYLVELHYVPEHGGKDAA